MKKVIKATKSSKKSAGKAIKGTKSVTAKREWADKPKKKFKTSIYVLS